MNDSGDSPRISADELRVRLLADCQLLWRLLRHNGQTSGPRAALSRESGFMWAYPNRHDGQGYFEFYLPNEQEPWVVSPKEKTLSLEVVAFVRNRLAEEAVDVLRRDGWCGLTEAGVLLAARLLELLRQGMEIQTAVAQLRPTLA